jgi:hypothetical protein
MNRRGRSDVQRIRVAVLQVDLAVSHGAYGKLLMSLFCVNGQLGTVVGDKSVANTGMAEGAGRLG